MSPEREKAIKCSATGFDGGGRDCRRFRELTAAGKDKRVGLPWWWQVDFSLTSLFLFVFYFSNLPFLRIAYMSATFSSFISLL